MYLFVYKTSHKNGRYYIGRHQTNNLNDGYLGSGKWVCGIKDKSSLTREILAEASSFEELCALEEYYILQHFGKPGCMNMKRGSQGNTSEDAKEFARRTIENGTHNFLGGEIQRKRVENGSHPFLGGEISRKTNAMRLANGTHNLVGARNPIHQRIADGTYHMFGENNIAVQRVANGTHNFLGPELNLRRIKEGTHNLIGPNAPSQFVWTCDVCGKTGKGKGVYTRFHGASCRHNFRS
jgi:hypothetical protein